MESPIEQTGTSTWLPALREGQNSLVGQPRRPPSLTSREKASEWALDIRKRISSCIDKNEEVKSEDISTLKQELVAVFIATLQQDSHPSWSYLTEILELVQPYNEYFEQFCLKEELHHYIERLVHHAQLHRERLFELQIVERLSKVFPKEVQEITQTVSQPFKNYCSTSAPSLRLSSSQPSSPARMVPPPFKMMRLPDGKNPYSTYIPSEEQLHAVKPLTFGDLRKSIATVAVEMSMRESVWSHPYGPITLALQTDIPEERKETKELIPTTPPGYRLTPRTSRSSIEKRERKTPRAIEEEKVPMMNGREAVEFFAACEHAGQIRSLYLNRTPCRHYRPYDLITVPKIKADPEHYVFSTFGVLHVFSDAPAESMSLAEWQREAVLWKACSSIPFFKNYLIRKMFDRWRCNKLHLDFLRRQAELRNSLLQAVPSFGSAFLQVSKLLKELVTIQFLPFETKKTYQLPEFENNVNYKNIQAQKILEKFFRYCKMIVDVTAEESFRKLKYCEEQFRKKTYFSKDSLHLQKVKEDQRRDNLQKARSETGRLGNFVKLVDQLIVEHMFFMAKNQVISFVSDVLIVTEDASRDGFFRVNLVFTKHDVLGISPSKERVQRTLTNTLKGIPTVLCANVIPMDGYVQEQESPEDGESQGLKPEPAKSSTRMQERRKSTAATTMSSVRQESCTHASEVEKLTGISSQQGEGSPAVHTDGESQSGVSKSVVLDGTLALPEFPREATQTKEEDDLGIATPDLVIKDDGQGLVVEGEGFMGQYQPLKRANLEEKLEMDKEFQKSIQLQSELLKDAFEEIDHYNEQNKWLDEIHQFCKKWTDKTAKEYRGIAAFTIEQKLNELRQWSEKVRNFDRSFITENGLFFIDCSAIHDILLPRLNDIYLELVTLVADEAKNLARSFCDEMKIVLQNMKDKTKTVDCFATYAKNFTQYKKNTSQYQQRVEYIKSLYEVIRMSYRQLTSEEEKYEENVWSAWEAFLLQMQDASEFVNTQTPLMTQMLEDTYQRLEKEAFELSQMATSGKFLDPQQNPTQILIDMRKMRERFYAVQKQLQQASKWRDAICAEPYDLTFLNEMTVKMDVRQELWKYVEVSTHAIKDWKQMLFKKMNMKKALEKVIEWQAAASQLRPYLPEADLLLTTWFRKLQEFKKDLPILHKLANDALKERHWKAIFVGMNEAYDPKKQFTVADLLTYDLEEHAQLIHSIYLGAVAEYDLELKIGQIKRFWEEREFKLAKHIPDSILLAKARKLKLMQEAAKRRRQNREPKKQPSPKRRSKLEKYRQERAAAISIAMPGLNIAEDDYYILIEVDELKYQLEDSRISIKGMMQSPYLGDMSAEVEYWNTALQEVEEITDLWYLCQKKWMYLLKIFEWPSLYRKFSRQAKEFENVHAKVKDWMRVVSNDSKVLTVVNRRRGEKGYRLLQGDNLRSLFLQLTQQQEEILKYLMTMLDSCRMEFNRLYFLSDEELVSLLGVSRNPQALLPFTQKCFPGITSLAFALPPGTSSLNTHLDFALHADKLQVIAMRGILGEEVPFCAHLEAQPKSTQWLKMLEGIMKNTMAIILQTCVQARMEEGSRQPIHLLEELARYSHLNKPLPRSNEEEEITLEIKHTFRHWMLRFPIQCVCVAEGILWQRSIQRAFEKPEFEPDDLKFIRMNLAAKLDQYIDLLKESAFNGTVPGLMKERLFVLLSTLVNQSIEHKDVMDAMLKDTHVSEKSFDYLKLLRYHMDIRNVLRAKTVSTEAAGKQQSQISSRKTSRQRKASSLASKNKMETIEEPEASLSRTKTTVTTDYQFSTCFVQQMGYTFNYDYEYLGPVSRLILTPLTQRAFLSLTQTLKNFHCGTLIGPPGTGKSETIKDLAKFFGMNLFTINCNADMTLPMMTQYMMGMVLSGCWALFDDTDRLTRGLMSVTAQHLDYLRTALRTLEASGGNQYKIRGQPRFDKKTGVGDTVIRRNSLTTLHPLPNRSVSPPLERQKTVPHGFNEKGLVTYFEETWIPEKEQRRHSIEKEIDIKESELYKTNRPPPLFYEARKLQIEHARFKGKKAAPDYSKLLQEPTYIQKVLGNLMFNGNLVQASANFGCFMTINTDNPASATIPETFRLLLRPCAMVIPDYQQIIDLTLCCHGYHENQLWAKKLDLFFKQLKVQLPRKKQYMFGLKDIKSILKLAVLILHDLQEIQEQERQEAGDAKIEEDEMPPLMAMDQKNLEEESIVQAIIDVMYSNTENEDDRLTFLTVLREVFSGKGTTIVGSGNGLLQQDSRLMTAIRDQLNEDNLKETSQTMEKVLQLYATIQQKQGVILYGQAGSAKTTCLGVLARALNRLNYLLFAPDHSKDELSTDRDMLFQSKQKLQEMNMPDLVKLEDEFLSKLGAPKLQQSKGGKKFRRMSSLLTKVQDAIHEMENKKTADFAIYPKIDVVRLNPTALSIQELLGTFSDGMWKGGLLPKILRDSSYMSEAVKSYLANFKEKQKGKQEMPSILLRWLVLDGVLNPCWTESLNTLLDSERKLSMANGGRIPFQDESTTLLFETADISNSSPAILSRCKLIHFGSDAVHWSWLFECWAKTAKSKWIFTGSCMKVIEDLVRDVFGPTIKFIQNECSTALLTDVGLSVARLNEVTSGIQEVTSFIMMFSALLDRGFSRDEFEKKIRTEDPDEETKLIIITRNLDEKRMPSGMAGASRGQANSRMTSSSQIEQSIPNYMNLMKGMFAMAYIWAFGGHLHERHKDKFHKFAHDCLYRATHPIRLPLVGTVFDYNLDEMTGTFVRWSQKAQGASKSIAGGFILTPEVEKYTFLTELMLGSHQPVLITGMPGVGKTSLIQNMILSKQPSTTILMSPGMKSAIFQEAMMAHILDLKSRAFNVMSAPGPSAPKLKQKHLFFIDDLNAAHTSNGYQPPLELLTQILSQGGAYDRQRKEFQNMEEACFVAAATLPTVPGVGMGHCCHVISSRLTRLFFNLTVFSPGPEGILSTFGRTVQNWLEEFPTYSVEHHFEFARALTLGLLELYQRVKDKFRPTPAHAHYIFTIHDIAKVVQGILLMSPRSRTRKMLRVKKEKGKSGQTNRQTSHESYGRSVSVSSNAAVQDGSSAPMMRVIAQLWCHECTRTFADRLVTEDDHQWFGHILEEIVVKQFCKPRDDPMKEMTAISEETHSQSLHSPHECSPLIRPTLNPPEDEEGENADVEDEDMTDHGQPCVALEVQNGAKSDQSGPGQEKPFSSTPVGYPGSRGEAGTSQLTQQTFSTTTGTIGQSVTVDTNGGDTTDAETMSSPTQGQVEATFGGETANIQSETEEETSASDESSGGETTETETDTIMTGTDYYDGKTAAGESSISSRGTSQTSDTSRTTDSDQEFTDRSVRFTDHQGKRAHFADQPDLGGYGRAGHKLRRQSSRTGALGGTMMRKVHFKPGLMADWEHEAYFGPLLKLEEIKGQNDSLTDIIFSKFYMTCHTETQGLSVEKGYIDTTEEALTEALQTCLAVYNAGTSQRLELVFFSEAVKHAARLSRVLAIPGGHALLLGTSYSTGRATLIRLASYIAHCKLFEPKPQTDTSKNLRIVREHIKRACYHTGILGKPTVLLIHEDLGADCLHDVTALMAEGTSPGLYTEEEMQSIVSQMMPGGVQTKRIDKIEQAFDRFLKRIRQNLHVIVCLSFRGNSYSSDFRTLHSLICRYPALIKHSCCIDHFKPWPYEAYVNMARVWLEDQRSKIPIPWSKTKKSEQITMMSKAMAYMHLSAKTAIERQFCHQRDPLRFFSPLTFMEFVHIFRIISAFITKTELINIGKHERALGKVNEAFGSIDEFKRQVSDLSPQHKSIVEEIKILVEEVEQQKQDYIQALDKCKDQELKIEELQGPLEQLRRDAQSEFDKLNPNYQAAMMALNALNKRDLDEVRSYREPPELVRYVLNALCLLFGRTQDYENGKQLLNKENFIQELIFYDKDNIPVDIFIKLQELIKKPQFQYDVIERVSKAAAGICLWVHAITKYSEIHRTMQPRLRNLLEHEEKFTKAQARLGQLRVEANRIKSALERKIVDHKSAVKRAKTIFKHMQNIERKIARAVNLMENMSVQHFLWKSELKKARHHINTAPGDALITAACVCYHGPLNDKSRAELLQDWLDRCKQGNFTMPKHFGQEVYPLSAGIEGLLDSHKDKDSVSEVSSSHPEASSQSDGAPLVPMLPEIRMYKYQPAVYDTSKYYKSELKKQGSFEYEPSGNYDLDDEDDEDDASPLVNRTAYNLQDILSDFDELSQWRLDGLPTDLHSIQNGLAMRVSCYNRKHCWPLLIDPDNQAEMWVKKLQNSKNIFTEIDVREGTPDEIDALPSLHDSSPDDDHATPLPPSRGSRATALTFSDVAIEYPPDDHSTDQTTSTTITSTTDYTKSFGRHSRNTWNSEELRPVTSVTASWEIYSLHADQQFDHPEHNLWIIEADDPTLDSRLVNAIVHGVTVLVTHLERKPIDPMFRGLLLKHFYVDKEGNKVVRVGSYEFRSHPKFCLYLSTSVPLFLKGDGLHSIPIQRMCIINMALSDEAIINHLLHETMKIERKEFEGQKRSNETDIILHRQRLHQEHELIREKTLNLTGPILEDQTMLESLINCQKEIEHNKMILEETRYMGDHLEEKFAHYIPMIMECAMLYNMIKKMSVLHSYYYLPFYKYVEMFKSILKARDRGKGSLGAPSARARELSDAIYLSIFSYVSLMMFEQHFLLLQLLVSLERMRIVRKCSTKELSLFLNGFDKHGIDETLLMEHKPAWMKNQAWVDCIILEQLHHPFHGLTKSLIHNYSQWEEYFQHPVALMNPVPGTTLQELSIFQKCLLWKFCCPEKLSEVAQAIVLYELGSIRTIPDHYNIRDVYNYSSKTTPVVFILPLDKHSNDTSDATKGLPYVSPAHEVKRLAKEVGMEGKVRVMNFGVRGQIAEVCHALEDCVQSGYWLLLQNYHLAEEPQPQFFSLLKNIVYTKWAEERRERQDSNVTDDGFGLVTPSKNLIKEQELMINPTFRLWITTQSDIGRLIPGVMVQHGVKVTVESTGNFHSTLQKSYRSVAYLLNDFRIPGEDEAQGDKSARIMPLALLHSLLLQQCYYGNSVFTKSHRWSLTDLAMAVDIFKKIMMKCENKSGLIDLIPQIYANHCIIKTDSDIVKALGSTLVKHSITVDRQKHDSQAEMIVDLLNKLLKTEGEVFNLKRAIDSMEEMTARTFGLPPEADTELTAASSNVLSKDMVQVVGAPELFLRVTTSVSSAILAQDSLIPQFLSQLQNLPIMPETSRNQVYAKDILFHFEVEGFKDMVERIQSDLSLLQRRVKGEVLPEQSLDNIIYALNKNSVPKAWISQTFESCSNVQQWIKELPARMSLLRSYILEEKTATYNLSVFVRPDRFIEAVKHTYARKHFKDINAVDIEIELRRKKKEPIPLIILHLRMLAVYIGTHHLLHYHTYLYLMCTYCRQCSLCSFQASQNAGSKFND
ncbi:hypothetical protein ACJMK2_023767 [Sinanodonta woodiana]|uniref:AAA+ ATPase domain-containing protein n=1 Tax=Sinanodonta woodiana TaxID=1069815 RepID=A0ABD3T5B2_SINWO